ncbi:MAG: PIN domain-containing protein [Candidatus Zambryskibacteria bacterium]|nr:PIN domain-containing protein [Candidatus Zambryskibacteria bacterium]
MESYRFIVDSSVFVAFYYKDDSDHNEALRVMTDLEHKLLVVHPYVIQEVVTVLTYKAGNKTAGLFLQDIFDDASDIIIPPVTIYADAEFFKSFSKKVSFTDATLIHLSKTLRIPVVTFDRQIISLLR